MTTFDSLRPFLWALVLSAVQVCASIPPAAAVDTGGDGLLDLLDVPGFDPEGEWGRV